MLSDKQLLLMLLQSGWDIKAKHKRNGISDFHPVSEEDIVRLCESYETIKFSFRIGDGVTGIYSGRLDYNHLQIWGVFGECKTFEFDNRNAVIDERKTVSLVSLGLRSSTK